MYEKITRTFHLVDMCSPVSDNTVRWLLHVCSNGQFYPQDGYSSVHYCVRLVFLYFSRRTIGHCATDCKHGSLLPG